jgi:hypothetical protein
VIDYASNSGGVNFVWEISRPVGSDEFDLGVLDTLRECLCSMDQDFGGLCPASQPTNIMTNVRPNATR